MNRAPRAPVLFVRMTLMVQEPIRIVVEEEQGSEQSELKPCLFQCHTGGQSKLQGRTIKSRVRKMSLFLPLLFPA
jgi:hypothetical protein